MMFSFSHGPFSSILLLTQFLIGLELLIKFCNFLITIKSCVVFAQLKERTKELNFFTNYLSLRASFFDLILCHRLEEGKVSNLVAPKSQRWLISVQYCSLRFDTIILPRSTRKNQKLNLKFIHRVREVLKMLSDKIVIASLLQLPYI
jgi:hypothetical protein